MSKRFAGKELNTQNEPDDLLKSPNLAVRTGTRKEEDSAPDNKAR